MCVIQMPFMKKKQGSKQAIKYSVITLGKSKTKTEDV